MGDESQTRIDKPTDLTPTQNGVAQNGDANLQTPHSTALLPEIEALIEAAVSSMVGDPVHVRSVTPIEKLEKSDAANAWAIEGRVAVHSSHNQRVRHS